MYAKLSLLPLARLVCFFGGTLFFSERLLRVCMCFLNFVENNEGRQPCQQLLSQSSAPGPNISPCLLLHRLQRYSRQGRSGEVIAEEPPATVKAPRQFTPELHRVWETFHSHTAPASQPGPCRSDGARVCRAALCGGDLVAHRQAQGVLLGKQAGGAVTQLLGVAGGEEVGAADGVLGGCWALDGHWMGSG